MLCRKNSANLVKKCIFGGFKIECFRDKKSENRLAKTALAARVANFLK
jgi:hypothetical protein